MLSVTGTCIAALGVASLYSARGISNLGMEIVPVDHAAEALQAALRGEPEPVD